MADISTNTTTAKGLEAAIMSASGAITKMQSKVDTIFNGKYSLSKKDLASANFFKKVQDRGVLYVLDTLSSVDFCNILNYLSQQIPSGKAFNPDDTNIPNDPIGRAKWNIQYKAFQVQSAIDGYYQSYGDVKNPNSKAGLQDLVKFIQDSFGEILNPESQADFNNPELVNKFPELSTFNNFLQNSLGVFNKYTDLRNIPNSDLQKIIQYVDKIRAICIAVQGLNSPTAALGLANTFLSGKIQEDFDKINKLVDPARMIPFLKRTIDSCKSVLQIARVVSSYISFGRLIIRLCVLLVKIFKRILDFLVFLGVPNVYTTLGITNKMSTVVNKQVQVNGIDNFINRLNQINAFLGLISNFVVTLVIDIQTTIDRLNAIVINLQNCNNVDPQLVTDLNDLINALQAENDGLKKFLKDYDDNKKKRRDTSGEYTIQIITEQTVDTNYHIKRRYGVALDYTGAEVVQTTPTYASLDDIIINEVKQLLVSKGLVKPGSDYSTSEMATINESLNYLDVNNINVDNIDTSIFDQGLDPADNENEDVGLGLNAFVNKLSGGKKLRKRMRKVMSQQSQQLTSDLQLMKTQ
jgi:hypothetical protein